MLGVIPSSTTVAAPPAGCHRRRACDRLVCRHKLSAEVVSHKHQQQPWTPVRPCRRRHHRRYPRRGGGRGGGRTPITRAGGL
eukprot:365377-Chlamydomonas_euryale.AAC.47